MPAATLHQQFESLLHWQPQPEPDLLPSGIPQIDLPRGCLTEIVGPASSGRTSLMLAILAQATAREEVCAVVDAEDTFSPHAAADAGVDLTRLLWIRCGHNAEHALRVADLLIQGGGFGVVVMDLGDTSAQTARRISLTSWFRLRRAVENTPSILISLARQSNAKTCASLVIECGRTRAHWSGTRGVSRLLRNAEICARSTKRRIQCSPVFTAKAI